MQIFSKRKRNNSTIFSKRKRNNGTIFSKRKRKERFYLGNYIHDTVTKNNKNYFNQQLKQHYFFNNFSRQSTSWRDREKYVWCNRLDTVTKNNENYFNQQLKQHYFSTTFALAFGN